MNAGAFKKKRRAIFWTIFIVAALSVIAIMLIPSGSHAQPIPPDVTLQGISRPEAERVYGHHQWVLRHLIWNELTQFEFRQAWHRLQVLRYSHVQTIRKDSTTYGETNSVTLTVVYAVPGKSTSTNEQKMYFRYGTTESPTRP